MSDSKATPAAVPSDAPSAGPASAPPVDALAVPAAAGEATTQSGAATPNGTTSAASGSAATTAAAAASRKRVFTFQKRWLHTLPIMEKTLPDSALDAASFAALKSANLVGDDGKPVDDANAHDVIVCMLCDDPHSNRDVMKIWSRLNCRRGRIENHLMSKHPEFMLLLKQKREAEGDLAVQIFLQNMREGRCNVRSEISSGLYSNMQATLAPGTAHAHSELQLQAQKRTFGHDDFMMPAQATVNVTAGLPYRNMRDASDVSDVENRRKRAKSNGNGRDGVVATPMMLANAPVPPSPVEPVQRGPLAAFGELLHAALMSYIGPVGFAQWRGALADKMVVITGGERPSIARAASNLWLMGANVLVTFADQESTEAFAASYLAQLHNTEGVEPPRGVMLPLFCSLHTRPQIDEWTRSIASKFERVDFLINFVGEESDPKKNDAASLSDAAGANRERSKSNVDESISSSANRILEICQAFSSTCMQRGGRSAIVNITTQSDNVRTSMNCAAIEVMTKSLSNDLRASQVQVNCIVVEQSGNDTSEASAEQELELLHTILFLLSPASTRISGSVIHQRRQEVTTRSAAGAEPITTQSTTAEAIDVVQNQVI